MLGFLLAGAALAATAAFAVSALRLESFAVFALAWWVAVCAQVVVATEILSLAHAIRPLGYALFEAGALAVAVGVWLRSGRPRPPQPPRPWVELLLAVVLLGVAYELFLVLATPPNNWDSMHYHLARVAAWHAQGHLGYFPTHNGIENVYPQNAELLVLWTVTFLGRDLVAALPQLLSMLVTTLSIYVTARRLGQGARTSALAALVFPTLTIVALESVTTQNDLVEAAFVTSAVAFALGRTRAETALAGLALGLAAGTKLTFLYALAPLLAIGLLVLTRRRLAEICVAAVAGFALVGMYAYVQNVVETGRPQGKAHEVSSMPPDVTFTGTVSSVLRTTYRLIDLGGYHPPAAVTEHLAGAAKRVFETLHVRPNPDESTTKGTFEFEYRPNVDVSEDSSAFGPLGFLLVLPLSIGVLLWRGLDRRYRAFALALPLYVVALALGTRWNLYVGRFLTTPVALTLPLAPLVLRRIEVRIVVFALAAATLGLVLAYNPSKPPGLWNRSREYAQTIRWPEQRPVVETVAARVPADARLGVNLRPSDWEYPFWGSELERRLVWLPEQSAGGLDWVLLGTRVTARPPGRWCAQRFPSVHWTLLRRC